MTIAGGSLSNTLRAPDANRFLSTTTLDCENWQFKLVVERAECLISHKLKMVCTSNPEK
jgi:hypothetical protein